MRFNHNFRENNGRFDGESSRDRPSKLAAHSRSPNNPLSFGGGGGNGFNQNQRPLFLGDIEQRAMQDRFVSFSLRNNSLTFFFSGFRSSANPRNIDTFSY